MAATSQGTFRRRLALRTQRSPYLLLSRHPTADRLSGRSAPPARPRHTGGITVRFGVITLGIALLVALALRPLIADPLLAWLIAITVITYFTYGYDKNVAGSEMMRVPEIVLLGLAIVGGTFGAITGMHVFHHKTAKDSFRWKFYLVVIGQSVVISVYYALIKR